MTDLTPAERRCLAALAAHGSVKAAAFALGRSPYTLTVQLASARRKLGAASSLQAYARAGIAEKRE